jgi:hypothetical protein
MGLWGKRLLETREGFEAGEGNHGAGRANGERLALEFLGKAR